MLSKSGGERRFGRVSRKTVHLPNADRAVIEPRKLDAYLLAPEHPTGQEKARFFAAAGYTRRTATQLHHALLGVARNGHVRETTEDAYGIRHVVDGAIQGRSTAPVMIRTVWMIDRGAEVPRLITASIVSRAMINELDVVVLARDLAEHGLLAGDLGTVVDRSADGRSFLVEFVRGDGVTVTVERLGIDELRRMTGNEIAHARQL